MTAVRKQYYLEDGPNFWEITVNNNETQIRSGKIGKPGRKFPSKKHGDSRKASQFAYSYVNVKLADGYIDPKEIDKPSDNVPAAMERRKSLRLEKQKSMPVIAKQHPKKRKSVLALTKQDTITLDKTPPNVSKWRKPNRKQSTIRRMVMPKSTQKVDAGSSSSIQGTPASTSMKRKLTPKQTGTPKIRRITSRSAKGNNVRLFPKEATPFTSPDNLPPTLSRMDTLKLNPNDAVASTSALKSCQLPSLTFGKDNVYIPPASKWPINMDGPILWCDKAAKSGKANAVLITSTACYYGTSAGIVVKIDFDGCRQHIYRVQASVRCITQQAGYIYIACNNGCIYDITNTEPRLVYQTINKQHVQICGMSIQPGIVVFTDVRGHIMALNHNLLELWSIKSGGEGGWMLCTDTLAAYHGHTQGVTKYNIFSGEQIWKSQWKTVIRDGIENGNHLYVNGGKAVYKMKKSTGHVTGSWRHELCKDIQSVTVGSGMLFASAVKQILCFDEKSHQLIYKFHTLFTALDLQYDKGCLYCASSSGFTVLNLSKDAITKPKSKSPAVATVSTLPFTPSGTTEAAPILTRVPSQSSIPKGFTKLLCQKEKDGSLVVRPTNNKLHEELSCEFPVHLRRPGATYAVQELRKSETKEFYRVSGSIIVIQ